MAPCEPQAGPNLSNLEHIGSAWVVIRPEQVLERVSDDALTDDLRESLGDTEPSSISVLLLSQ